MKKVIFSEKTSEVPTSEIDRDDFVGTYGDGQKSIFMEKYDNSYLPFNVTAGFNEWHPLQACANKSMGLGNEVYVFDSLKEMLEWAAE